MGLPPFWTWALNPYEKVRKRVETVTPEVLDEILKQKDTKKNEGPLHWIAENGVVGGAGILCYKMILLGADPEERGWHGRSAIMAACMNTKGATVEAVEGIVAGIVSKHGVDSMGVLKKVIDARMNDDEGGLGRFPLLVLADLIDHKEDLYVEVTRLLMRLGCDREAKNSRGHTALSFSKTETENEKAIQVLENEPAPSPEEVQQLALAIRDKYAHVE